MKTFTWNDMKKFCENLTEDQLKQKVLVSREDEPVFKAFPEITEEDFYYNTDEPEDG